MDRNILGSRNELDMLRKLGYTFIPFEGTDQLKRIIEQSKKSANEIGDVMRNIDKKEKPFVDYEREYFVYELESLLKNMPEDTEVEFNDDRWRLKYFDNKRQYDFINKFDRQLHDLYYISEILNAKFKLVRPEPTGKWISATKSELLQAIFDSKTIGYIGERISFPRFNMSFSERAEYVCDNYQDEFNRNQLQIWEENK